MVVNYEGNTPKISCDNCGCDIELIELYRVGTGLHCPVCIGSGISHGHVGYVDDLRGTGIEECHLIRLTKIGDI